MKPHGSNHTQHEQRVEQAMFHRVFYSQDAFWQEMLAIAGMKKIKVRL